MEAADFFWESFFGKEITRKTDERTEELEQQIGAAENMLRELRNSTNVSVRQINQTEDLLRKLYVLHRARQIGK